jgi:hypothetical protein
VTLHYVIHPSIQNRRSYEQDCGKNSAPAELSARWLQTILILPVGRNANIIISVVSYHHFHKASLLKRASRNLYFFDIRYDDWIWSRQNEAPSVSEFYFTVRQRHSFRSVKLNKKEFCKPLTYKDTQSSSFTACPIATRRVATKKTSLMIMHPA